MSSVLAWDIWFEETEIHWESLKHKREMGWEGMGLFRGTQGQEVWLQILRNLKQGPGSHSEPRQRVRFMGLSVQWLSFFFLPHKPAVTVPRSAEPSNPSTQPRLTVWGPNDPSQSTNQLSPEPMVPVFVWQRPKTHNANTQYERAYPHRAQGGPPGSGDTTKVSTTLILHVRPGWNKRKYRSKCKGRFCVVSSSAVT